MPRLKNSLPKLCHHKGSNQTCVYHHGKPRYLGKWGSQKAKKAYSEFISAILNDRAAEESTEVAPGCLTVNHVILQFLDYAEGYYVKHGRPTDEVRIYKDALKVLVPLYGELLASEFSALKLKNVRHQMIELGRTRKHINKQVRRLAHVFRWAAGEELISASVPESLRQVDGLKKGRTKATGIQGHP